MFAADKGRQEFMLFLNDMVIIPAITLAWSCQVGVLDGSRSLANLFIILQPNDTWSD